MLVKFETHLLQRKQQAAMCKEVIDRYLKGSINEIDRAVLDAHLPLLMEVLSAIHPKRSIRQSRLLQLSLADMATTPVVLHTEEVGILTGYSRGMIFAKLRKGGPHYDREFPKASRLPGSKDLNFDSREVFAWIDKQLAKKNGGAQ